MEAEKQAGIPQAPDLTQASASDVIVLGQGLAGSALAWQLHWMGWQVAIVDRGEQNSASRVAAGLITPITGKRLTMMPDYLTYWASATAFYERVEQVTNSRFFFPGPMIRWFRSEQEERLFTEQRQGEYASRLNLQLESRNQQQGFQMEPAGRVAVSAFLDVTRDYFSRLGRYQVADVNVETDIRLEHDSVHLPAQRLHARMIVFAQGFQPRRPRWYAHVPDQPARGEVVLLRLPRRTEHRVTHQGVWIAPEQHGCFRVGATYDWKCLDQRVTAEGLSQLLSQVPQTELEGMEIVEHRAAVRPSMRNRRVVAEVHPAEPRVAILNGLGAKGSLVAPFKARVLADQIHAMLSRGCSHSTAAASSRVSVPEGAFVSDAADIRSEVDFPGRERLQKFDDSTPGIEQLFGRSKQPGGRRSLTALVHQILGEHLHPGDLAIDATAGQGFDTVFLASRVESAGHVWAFDVQHASIQQTHERLKEANRTNVTLCHQSHAELHACGQASGTIAAITFNLGYLPGSDKSVTTVPDSTLTAIQQGLKLLKPQGVMTVLAYRGHAGGQSEEQAVGNLLTAAADSNSQKVKASGRTSEWRWCRIEADPNNQLSPVLWLVQKLDQAV